MTKATRRVIYSGRVQGVGFRASTRRIARGFPVAGFVRNLPDGDVEVVVEGVPEPVDAFLAAVRGELGRWIRSESVQPHEPHDPPFSEFAIRY